MAIHFGNRIRVSVVAAVCLLSLVVALKNIVGVPTLVLTRDIVIFIMFYSGFAFLFPDKSSEMHPSLVEQPLFWSALIILITLGIIALYTI
jgi:hypothetical protein